MHNYNYTLFHLSSPRFVPEVHVGMERGFCDIGLGHCVLHYVIAACAAASLLYRRLKRAHWQGMPGNGWRKARKQS